MDRTTGTIQLKATFPNQRERLWPGQYVNVALILSTDANALVVPAAAVQVGRDGKYVYVVKQDPAKGNRVAEYRPVTVRQADAEIAVIASGLAKGETVVTDGHLRLAPGVSVEIKPAVGASSQPEAGAASTRAAETGQGAAGRRADGASATRGAASGSPRGGRP